MDRGVNVATFLEQARAGEVAVSDVDDFVGRWHDGEGAGTLREFLGLSTEEYGRWLLNPGALAEIIGVADVRPAREPAKA